MSGESPCRSVQRCVSATAAERRRRSAGFVITLEVLLVMVVFVLPMLIGMFLLGRKLVTLYLNHREFLEMPYSRAVVWDSSDPPKVIGPVIGYDPYEAPLVIFRDSATQAGVALGVRRNWFTSFGEVFYSNNLCTADPRLRGWGASRATGTTGGRGRGGGRGGGGGEVEPELSYPPVGFMYQMQQRSYAMGNLNILYTSDGNGTVPATTFTAGVDGPLFVWKSQDLTPSLLAAPPTEPCFMVPDGTTIHSLVPAIAVIDFDDGANYRSPFRVAFPSPGDPIAVPPSSGG